LSALGHEHDDESDGGASHQSATNANILQHKTKHSLFEHNLKNEAGQRKF
jgi:hypothetical protein